MIMFSILYKALHHRPEEDIPRGLSRATVLQAFHHHHQLMIRALYPECQITATRPVDSDTTAFSVRNQESGVVTECSLTSLDGGLGAEIDVGLGMKIACRWTIHSWNGDQDTGNNNSSGSITEQTVSRRRVSLDSRKLHDMYLVEDTTFTLLKRFNQWARDSRDRSKALEYILVLLGKLESGEIRIQLLCYSGWEYG
ncbi:hypothetical protein BDV26DRAFT_259729 [Aspergillus bertholletiae]|uniref:Uncharacterized protein n=1 Tax=Aspergillus bertholletiae TaxID=1226010 RepID=A0A5N7BC95_9EURO|nr:hypothetical protein BDV26DRAFT_259729 [Aspergillus bertholletiae]